MSERAQRLRLVEALLFAADTPLEETVLAQYFADEVDVGELLLVLVE